MGGRPAAQRADASWTTPVGATFSTIREGDSARFVVRISDEMVRQFVELTGDRTPVHTDPEFARETVFEGLIVHGMLENALFSRLVGMDLTGGNGFCISQQTRFLLPIRPNTEVTVQGRVRSKSEAMRTVTIETQVLNGDGQVAVEGSVVAMMLK